MKRIAAFILFTVVATHTYGQESTPDKLVQATIINFFDGIARLDDAAMKAEVTSDFTLVEHGQIMNVDSLITYLGPLKGKNIKRVNKIDFIKTEQTGNAAIVVYYNTADLTMGDKQRTIKWLESAVLVKGNGAWKIKLLHSTDLK